jgi:hypothetical protein
MRQNVMILAGLGDLGTRLDLGAFPPLVLIVNPGRHFFFKGGRKIWRAPGSSVLLGGRAFHRSKHLLEDLFERASRGYEWLVPTLDVLAECFEPRDALGSHDEYSEDVCS